MNLALVLVALGKTTDPLRHIADSVTVAPCVVDKSLTTALSAYVFDAFCQYKKAAFAISLLLVDVPPLPL